MVYLYVDIVVHLLSHVPLFAPRTAAHQAPCLSLSLEFVQTHVHRVDDAIQPSHWIYIAYRCVCTHTVLLYLYQLTNLYSSQHGPIRCRSALCDSNSASNCEHFAHQ